MSLILFSDYRNNQLGEAYSSSTPEGWEGTVNVAGVSPSQLSVDYKDRKVFVSKDGKEIYYFPLPRYVDPETLSSEYSLGLLKIKAECKRSEMPRKIVVVEK